MGRERDCSRPFYFPWGCGGVCTGASPVGHPNLDGPKFAGYRFKTKGWLLTVREPPDASPVWRVRVPLAKPRSCGATCPSDHPVVQLRENTGVIRREAYGVRPACRRFRVNASLKLSKGHGVKLKAVASHAHSIRCRECGCGGVVRRMECVRLAGVRV